MGQYGWLRAPNKKIFREPRINQSGARSTPLGTPRMGRAGTCEAAAPITSSGVGERDMPDSADKIEHGCDGSLRRLVHDQQRHRSLARATQLRRVSRRQIASAALLPRVRRSRTTSLVAFVLAVLIGASPAALADFFDSPSQFAILGVGSAPCTSVTKAVGQTGQIKEADRQAMLAWAQGYLSFYNSVTEGTYDVTAGVGATPLQEWLFEFCRQNPQASLVNAVDELLVGGAPHPSLTSIRH